MPAKEHPVEHIKTSIAGTAILARDFNLPLTSPLLAGGKPRLYAGMDKTGPTFFDEVSVGTPMVWRRNSGGADF
ncbi:unnamed protein product [marine sediment metagenome]|uniref:Uncharacterized protein n=1 Tax=marine sediment metagenome TaxID=412755 RepID=X1RBN5_9ZZZZ